MIIISFDIYRIIKEFKYIEDEFKCANRCDVNFKGSMAYMHIMAPCTIV